MAVPKILIIEDEPVHLNVMKAKLEHEGYNVLVATDGEAGYQMARDEKPDLVLLDIILPKINGFEVLERLKKDNSTVPVIIISNSGQPVEVDRAIKMGARDYLVKAEFNPADVLEKVEKAVGRAEPLPKSVKPSSAVPPSKPAAEDVLIVKDRASGEGGKASVLIVEDDKFLRDLIVQKLKRDGFLTLEALDGEEGLKISGEKRPDLILLDLILPGLDGFEVLRRLKADKQLSQIPVIVLSNLGQKEDMDRAMSGGAEDFMVKAHFTPGEIISKIKAVLKKKYF